MGSRRPALATKNLTPVERASVNAVEFTTASISRKVREQRKGAGLSQGAVAKKAKIRQETLSRIEHGLGNPTVEIIGRIAWAIEQLDKKNPSPRTLREIRGVESRKKVIQVELNNSDLNALEDLLYCILTSRGKRDAEEKVKRLWNVLVEAWDGPSKTSQQPVVQRPRATAGSRGARKFIPGERVRRNLGI
jgi:transcriptional regulator with XRE-family HTH domain